MAIIELEEIKKKGIEVVDDHVAKLNDHTADIDRVAEKNLETLDTKLDAASTSAAEKLGGALADANGQLGKVLNEEGTGALPRLGAALDERIKKLDENQRERIEECDKGQQRRLQEFSTSVDERLTQLDGVLTNKVAQLQDDVIEPGFRRIEEVMDSARRRFVRAMLLLLNAGGILILILTHSALTDDGTMSGGEIVRTSLFALFFVFSMVLIFSNSVLDLFLGTNSARNS